MNESGFNFSASTNRIGRGPVTSIQLAQATVKDSLLISGWLSCV